MCKIYYYRIHVGMSYRYSLSIYQLIYIILILVLWFLGKSSINLGKVRRLLLLLLWTCQPIGRQCVYTGSRPTQKAKKNYVTCNRRELWLIYRHKRSIVDTRNMAGNNNGYYSSSWWPGTRTNPHKVLRKTHTQSKCPSNSS